MMQLSLRSIVPRVPCFLRTLLTGSALLAVSAGMAHGQATSPSLVLASTNVGATVTGTVTFTFTASTTVGLVAVVTGGIPMQDFQLGTQTAGACAAGTYAQGSTCTVAVKFIPTAPGLRAGAAMLYSSSGVQQAEAYLSGTGLGGQLLNNYAITSSTTVTTNGNISGVVVDPAGNLFLSDIGGSGNLYKEAYSSATGGYTSSIVATGTGQSYGLALDPSGNLYVTDNNAERILLETFNPVSGSYTQSTLFTQGASVHTVQVDSVGNLYYDASGVVIKQTLNPATGTYTKSTVTGLQLPVSIAVDAAGNLYIADSYNQAVYLETYSAANGTYKESTIATGLYYLLGVAVDAAGNVYILNNGLYRYTLSGGTYVSQQVSLNTSVFGSGLALGPNGMLYVSGLTAKIVDQSRNNLKVSSSTAAGSTSTALSTAVINTGNVPATLGTFTATPPAVLASGTSACVAGGTLAVGASCNAYVAFAPTAHGASPQTGTGTFPGTNAAPFSETISGNVTGDPTQVVFTTPPAATGNAPATGNASGSPIRVTLEDANNAVAQYDTTAAITLTVTNSAAGYSHTYGPVNATAAVASFDTSGQPLTVAGTYIYTATSPGLTTATASQAVSAGPVASLTVMPTYTTAYAGNPDNVTVNGYDQYGNLAVPSTDTLALTSTDTTATLPANFALSGGTATKPVTFNQTGTFTVTATDTSTNAKGTSASITVQLTPAYTVTAATDPASGTAGNCTNQSLNSAVPDANCALRDAVAAVNALNLTGVTNGQPVIQFASSLYGQTITLKAPLVLTANVNLAGPGPAQTVTISGGGTTSLFSQSTASTTNTISGLTLTQGNAVNSPLAGRGGAWYSAAAITINFTNVTFNGNVTTYAGVAYGGAIYALGAPIITLSGDIFSGNKITSTSGQGYGGALFQNGGKLTINNSSAANTLFSGNSAQGSTISAGGALYLTSLSSGWSINGASFLGNQVIAGATAGYAGALFSSGTATNSIVNSLFSANANTGNSATYGGAIYLASGTTTITGTTFTGNLVTSTTSPANNHQGGAIYNIGTLTFYNNTITGNAATNASGTGSATYYRGGGVYSSTAVSAYNTVISGNTAIGANQDMLNVTSTANDYIDPSTTNACTTNCTPLLSALGSFGGPTQSMLPLPGSPLLRAGNTTNLNGATTDGRGFPRTLAGFNDIGATEANYSLAFVQQPGYIETGQPQRSTVQLYESGSAFAPGVATGSLGLADSAALGAGSVAMSGTGLEVLTETYSAAAAGDTITASVQTSAGSSISSATSAAFNVVNTASATYASLRMSAFPTPSVSGLPQPVTVTAVDNGGAPYAAYTGTVTFASSDAYANLPAAYTFTAADGGVHVFSVTLSTGGTQSLSVSNGTRTVTQTGIVTTGYVWALSPGVLTKDYANGTPISPSGYSNNSTSGLAFDAASNGWSLNNFNNNLNEFSPSGTVLGGYSGGGLSIPNLLAIDGKGQVWITNNNGSLSLFSNTGTALSPTSGFTGVTSTGTGYSAPTGIAIDASGNVWVANSNNTLMEVLGGAAPVAPLSTALTNNTTGARP